MKAGFAVLLALCIVSFFIARDRLNRRTYEILEAAKSSIRNSLEPVLRPGTAAPQLLQQLDEQNLVHGGIEPVRKEQAAKYKRADFVIRAVAAPRVKTPLLTCSIELELHLDHTMALSEFLTKTPCNETTLGMIFLK